MQFILLMLCAAVLASPVYGQVTHKDTLKSYFSAGAKPTGAQFSSLVDALGGISVNVENYGANCADGTDDATSFSSAISAVNAAGGGRVIVPAGTCILGSTITISENVILECAGRGGTTLSVTHNGNGIVLQASSGTTNFNAIENCEIDLPSTSTGNALTAIGNYGHIRGLQISGGSSSSWAIDMDRTNIWELTNINIGGSGDYSWKGSGIRFRNSDIVGSPFNFGDAIIQKADIELNNNNMTCIKFEGPDNSSNKINNVLLSQIECTGGAGGLTGDKGIWIYNSARITLHHVDIENISTCVQEDGAQSSGAIAENNSYYSVFALNCDVAAYTANGTTSKRTFIGNDNFPDTGFLSAFADGDAIIARNVWLGDASGNVNARIENDSGNLQFNDGNDDGSIQFTLTGDNPTIGTVETGGGARLFIGNSSARLVQISPALKLPETTSAPLCTDDGCIAYADGVSWNPMGDGYEGFVGRVNSGWVKFH